MIRVTAFPKKAAAKPKKQAIVISEDEDDSSPSKSQSKSKKSRDYSSDEDNSEVIIQVVHVLFHKIFITCCCFLCYLTTSYVQLLYLLSVIPILTSKTLIRKILLRVVGNYHLTNCE